MPMTEETITKLKDWSKNLNDVEEKLKQAYQNSMAMKAAFDSWLKIQLDLKDDDTSTCFIPDIILGLSGDKPPKH